MTANPTPIAGRGRELQLLLDRWSEAASGRGQVVLLSGEAGIGKSRLLAALRERIAADEHRWLTCRCQPHTQSSALFPLIEMIEQEFGWTSDSSATRLESLERSLAETEQTDRRAIASLAALLSISTPERLPEQSAEAHKRATLEALLGWLRAIARQQPLVVVAEDLHWADPSSLEFLEMVLRGIDDVRVLLLLTHRPEIRFPLVVRKNTRELRLSRLESDDVVRIVESLTGGRQLPGEILEHIVSRTEGVPLFVEELVKMVLESDLLVDRNGVLSLVAPLPALSIPTTLKESLLARLDRLGPAKKIAQLAAIVGRDFTSTMVAAVSGRDQSSIDAALDSLAMAGLVCAEGTAAYSFKHALVQEVAYESVPEDHRRFLHRQVADALAERADDIVRTRPELLAHHYTEARMEEPALRYWFQAGDRASKRSAFRESISHLRRGLDVLAETPDGVARKRTEVQFQVSLGDALIAVSGYGAPEVGAAYSRARELCRSLGRDAQLGFVLGGVWVYFLIRAEYRTALDLAGQLMELSEVLPIPLLEAGAHTALGATLMNLGDLVGARAHLERAVEHGDLDQLVLASDMRVSSLCFLGNVLAALGEPEAAVARGEEALARARDLGKPFFVANALTQLAWIHQLAGNLEAAERTAADAIELSTSQSYPYWQTYCLMTHGWALARRGDPDAGIAQMQRSEIVAGESGSMRGTAARLATLAEGYLAAGRPDHALATLDRAFAHVEKTGERFCEAELHRLRGEAAVRPGTRGGVAEADGHLRRAIDLARTQKAVLWEKRARASLERLGLG